MLNWRKSEAETSVRALFTVSNRFPSGNELGKRIFALNPGFPSSFSRRITVSIRDLTAVASLCVVFLLRFLAPVAVYFVYCLVIVVFAGEAVMVHFFFSPEKLHRSSNASQNQFSIRVRM